MELAAAQKRVALIPGVDNNRVGRARGDDGELRIVRTFHARFTGLKLGGGRSARERIAYVFREGKHEKDKADVEASAGDKDRLIEHADRIKATARVRRGRTAERILVEQIVELPAESTPEQRAKCAQAFVDSWRERGHSAVAVVHVHGDDKGKLQPHLHVEIAARPVDEAGNVDRSDVLWRGRATVYDERRIVADLVNGTCEPRPPYHPGGFRDIGREEDRPKGRIPPATFRPAAAAIREARAAGDKDRAGEATATMYAVSADKRAAKRERIETRRVEIAEHKDAGTWKQGRVAPLRERVVTVEERLKDEIDAERRRAARAEDDRNEARVDLKKAEKRAEKAERQARELNERQTAYVTDRHAALGLELPDLTTVEGQSAAWSNVRAAAGEAREQQAVPQQAPGAVDDSLLAFVSAAELEKARGRKRKAEAKAEKAGAKTEKQQASDEIREACRLVWRSPKWVADQLANVLETDGEPAAGARAWVEWKRGRSSRVKAATEEHLARVLEAVHGAADRLGATPLPRSMTVAEAEDEHERTRPRTPAEERAEWLRQVEAEKARAERYENVNRH